MQLTTAGREVWRGAGKAQVLQEAGAGDPTVQDRLRKLKQVEAFRKRKVDWPEIQSLVGISRATYYRWKKRLREEGLVMRPYFWTTFHPISVSPSPPSENFSANASGVRYPRAECGRLRL